MKHLKPTFQLKKVMEQKDTMFFPTKEEETTQVPYVANQYVGGHVYCPRILTGQVQHNASIIRQVMGTLGPLVMMKHASDPSFMAHFEEVVGDWVDQGIEIIPGYGNITPTGRDVVRVAYNGNVDSLRVNTTAPFAGLIVKQAKRLDPKEWVANEIERLKIQDGNAGQDINALVSADGVRDIPTAAQLYYEDRLVRVVNNYQEEPNTDNYNEMIESINDWLMWRMGYINSMIQPAAMDYSWLPDRLNFIKMWRTRVLQRLNVEIPTYETYESFLGRPSQLGELEYNHEVFIEGNKWTATYRMDCEIIRRTDTSHGLTDVYHIHVTQPNPDPGVGILDRGEFEMFGDLQGEDAPISRMITGGEQPSPFNITKIPQLVQIPKQSARSISTAIESGQVPTLVTTALYGNVPLLYIPSSASPTLSAAAPSITATSYTNTMPSTTEVSGQAIENREILTYLAMQGTQISPMSTTLSQQTNWSSLVGGAS